MIRVLIVDDEEPARELIKHYLSGFEEIKIIGECTNGFDGFKSIQSEMPDLLFLDIKMPKITGFEMLEMVEDPPLTIFSTAYDEYALKAFEMNAIDYLMKPYSKDRFEQAVHKAIDKLGSQNPKPDYMKLSEEVIEKQLDKIVVKNGSKIQIIPLSTIEYIEAQDDYVSIHCKEGKFLKQMTMKSLEQTLPTSEFIRIHRSYFLRVDQLKKIEAYTKDSYMATTHQREQLPMSRSGYGKLKEMLNI